MGDTATDTAAGAGGEAQGTRGPPFDFDTQLGVEIADIAAGRRAAGIACAELPPAGEEVDVATRAHDMRLLGLAFSGGGIRSATFNLGILQSLARHRLLTAVDYLSTVSGGGYIGSWLHTWVHREPGGIAAVQEALAPASGTRAEPPPVSWLRRYSNYLTPRVGLLSADTMAGVATYLRNVILNLVMLVALLAALLLAPWLVTMLPGLSPGPLLAGGGALILIGVALAARRTAQLVAGVHEPWEASGRVAAMALLLVGSVALGGGLFHGAVDPRGEDGRMLISICTLGYGVAWLAGWRLGFVRPKERGADRMRWFAWLSPFAAGAVLGAMLYGIQSRAGAMGEGASAIGGAAFGPPLVILGLLLAWTAQIGLTGRDWREALREWWSRFGGILLSAALVWIGVAGISLLGPYAVLWMAGWVAALGGLSWLAVTLAGVLAGFNKGTGGGNGGGKLELLAVIAPHVFILGMLVTLGHGLYNGLGGVYPTRAEQVCVGAPEAAGATRAYELRLRMETGSGGASGGSGEVYRTEPRADCDFGIYAEGFAAAIGVAWLVICSAMGLLVIAALLLGRRVDINVFAFHMFYRNRLERCYMGASLRDRSRIADPFTDLTSRDAPRLDALRAQPGAPSAPTQRPHPIINTALNITGGGDLAWQERKAASFTFTPDFCGYQLLPGGAGAYQRTSDFVRELKSPWELFVGSFTQSVQAPAASGGFLSLGVPITISGAAASPNAGYHTNPATAFLMTVFNVRLGWWMQNPASTDHWTDSTPPQALGYLLKELTASARTDSKLVYLSDGGHFENLGIYELVRRRCRYVIACDAGCDPEYAFEDLGNAIRKCRVDMGIDILINPRAILPDPATGRSRFHCAVGRIEYPDGPPGYLLYVKASVTGNEPADVAQYKHDHAAFPHESTGDQWYSESQFESYRRLGEHLMDEVIADSVERMRREGSAGDELQGLDAAAGAAQGGRQPACDLEALFAELRERWYPPSGQVLASFTKHGETLEQIFDRLRTDPNLRFMDAQIYPEWKQLRAAIPQPRPAGVRMMLPESEDELRAGFYFCNALIQLMENVYLDLDLEREHEHPDNRGWINLFKHWSWSGMFRVTWAVCAATYGARFQTFCRHRLGLQAGEVLMGDGQPPQALTEPPFNFLERKMVTEIVKHSYGGDAQGLSVLPLQLHVSDPFEDDKSAVAFTFGFALMRVEGSQRVMVFYRVQDHLRGMGLGRKGVELLLRTWGPQGLRFDPAPGLGNTPAGEGIEAVQRLCKSVEAEIVGRPGGDAGVGPGRGPVRA